jgi:hypothetical protein
MGWAVWTDESEGTAWAQGTHEYRPAGAAVIALTDQFRPRDFRPQVRHPERLEAGFRGFFGSLEEVNRYLRRGRRTSSRGTSSRRTPAQVH